MWTVPQVCPNYRATLHMPPQCLHQRCFVSDTNKALSEDDQKPYEAAYASKLEEFKKAMEE